MELDPFAALDIFIFSFFAPKRVSYWSQYIRAPGSSSYVLTVLMYWLQYDPPVWTWNLCTGSNMTPLSRL
jgi:hypothetical protein